MKIGTKLSLAVLLLLTAATAMLGVVTYGSSRDELEKSTLALLRQDAARKVSRLEIAVDRVEDDLLFLVEAPALRNLLARRADGRGLVRPPGDGDVAMVAVRRLFAAMLAHRTDYWQIRYLDESGRERVRVDLDDGVVSEVTGAALQDKAQAPYFQAAMKLPEKAVHISPLSLHREQGRVVLPHKPTLRFATPLFDARGTRLGVLVINLNAAAMLERIKTDLGNVYIVNRDGFFLKHPEAGRQFGFDLGHDYRLKDLHPRLVEQIAQADAGLEIWSGDDEREGAPHVHGFAKVRYDSHDKEAYWAVVYDVPEGVAFAVLRALRNNFLWLGALIAAFGGLAAYFFARQFARPLRMLAIAAEQVGAGDLKVALPETHRRDEIGLLIDNFQRMVGKLREITGEINQGVNVLAASASQILATTTQVATGAEETATAVAQTTATLEEVKQTAHLAVDKARLVADGARTTVDISTNGRQAVDETVARMHGIADQMTVIAEAIVRLSEQGQAIGEIIATVNDLAEQSSILAVNAAVEAAKAGEQGKGFAVVAQEVKNLAEQSKQATAQVRTILGEVQKATAGAVLATEQGSKAVDAGVGLSMELGASIQTLAASIAEAAGAATQIAVSAQQQLAGMDQAVLAIQNIREASAQNVASTRQAEDAARQLHDLGAKLAELVAVYRV